MAEFSGIRSKYYKEALREFPKVRDEDLEIMRDYLCPMEGEIILEVGSGSGFFSDYIAEMLGNGKLIVTDPSKEQLGESINFLRNNIEIREEGAEELSLDKESVDAIWSFGAFHHCFNKTKAFENFNRVLKKNGRLVIVDVLQGSKLAKHFDEKVAKYCVSGHEVSFLTKEFTKSLCFLSKFGEPEFFDLDVKWKFNQKEDIGKFLYKLHAMTKCSYEECLKGAEELLGVKEKNGLFYLDWPLTVVIIEKLI